MALIRLSSLTIPLLAATLAGCGTEATEQDAAPQAAAAEAPPAVALAVEQSLATVEAWSATSSARRHCWAPAPRSPSPPA
ncbi:MAG: hypothetical protein R3F55_22230 [Alphaproteobacteria bacterium]